MNNRRDSFTKMVAKNLLKRAILFASGLICSLFGFQNFGLAGSCLGTMAGILAGLLIIVLMEERASARAKSKAAGHGLRKRNPAQADIDSAFSDPARASKK